MGHDNVPSISPAKWRTTNPPSPSFSAFRKSGIHIRDEPFDKPDLGWKALLKRHQFLLFMLAILTFLCTVYLYFAITFASVDTCSSLQGKLKAQCYQLQKNAGQVHGHRLRRALLLYTYPEGSTYDLIQEDSLDDCGQQFENYSPCRNVSVFHGICRQRYEHPPMCKVPLPLGYQRPGTWQRSSEDTSRVLKHIGASGFPSEKVEEGDSIKIAVDLESSVFQAEHIHRTLTVEGQGCRTLPFGFMQERDESTLSILGANSSGLCIQNILDDGFPALLLTVFDDERLPAYSFDLIRSDGCGDSWNLRGSEYISELNRLLRPGGHFIGSCVGSGVEEWTEELKKLNWAPIAGFEDYSVWKKGEDVRVNGLEPSRINIPKKSSLQRARKLQYNQNMVEGGAPSLLRTDPKLQSLYAPSAYVWRPRVALYIEQLGNHIFRQVRNVLDMNAELGSFAAAVMYYHPVWVMNVVAASEQGRLDAIYDQGLFGIQHNWSEAFPTPPRSYDLVHSSWTFSDPEGVQALEMMDVILEVDRILRPGGLAIVRDAVETAYKVKLLSGFVRWRVLYEYPGETDQTEHVLIMRKEPDAR